MNKHTFIVVIIASIIGIVLISVGVLRYNDIYQNQVVVANKSTQNLAYNAELFVLEHQRLVELFAEDHADLVFQLAKNPENDQLEEKLLAKVKRYFPNSFAMTVSDKNGNPYIEDFDGMLGELCLDDLNKFSISKKNSPRIHPHIDAYHFDIMSEVSSKNKNVILFISFKAHVLSNAVRSSQAPGHKLLITYPIGNGLIEVTSGGTRDVLKRDSYLLTDEEHGRSLSKTKINGTSWFAEDFYQQNFLSDIKFEIAIQLIILYILLLGMSALLVRTINKEEKLKKEAEHNKNAFISSVSHEIRTPITSISGTISLVTNGITGEISPKTKEMLDAAQRNCTRLTFLINDILDIQKIEAGEMEYKIKEHNIVTTLQESITSCAQFVEKYNVKFNLIIPEEDFIKNIIFVNIDKNRIIQVLHNLLSNAAKYGAKDDTIDIKLQLKEGIVILDIIDHGAGIPDDIKNNLFVKFSRSASHVDKNIQGTGLGLNISRQIINKHGGTLTATSSPEKTCFTLTLPAL